ncbi:MAG: CPBP family intramembrane metalloprotease [Bifidobacteriaceae bacterium]|jgi:membrane protease YdiL (CAAX protease family)|nr:CPBP family intramembrane metalloprotease [Bifidobacteriaceae bacterium]
MSLYNWIYDPVSRLRPGDLLGVDQPYKPWPPRYRWRFNAGLRALVFWGTLFAIMVAGSLIFVLAALAGGALAGAQGASDPNEALAPVMDEISYSGLALTELLGAIVAYVVMTCAMEKRGWPVELGWRRLAGLAQGALVGFIAMSLIIGLLALAGSYRIIGFNGSYSPWNDLLMVGVTAGVAEELMFRGAMFRLLEDTFGSWVAIIGSCLVFGLIHVANPDGTLVGGMGIAIESLVFPALYMATRSLWWVIGLHFAWNMTQGPIWGSVVSGMGEPSSMLVTSWSGPEWLTGGLFGIEGSVVTMVVLGAFGVWLLGRVHRSGNFVQPFWRRRQHLMAVSSSETGPAAGEVSAAG